jgi:hypothetical protein
MVQQPLVGQSLLIIAASRSHFLDTPHSVGLLWTGDQPDAETSTWQHTTSTTDRHPCPRRVFFSVPFFPFDPFFLSFSSVRPLCHLYSILLSLYNKHKTNIHASGGIRTHNPSKRAAADPRLRTQVYILVY